MCSPCLFSLANYTYSITGSRRILLCKGILKTMPRLRAIWFLFRAINLGCPPSINFYSECFLFCRIIGYSIFFLIPLFIICFLAAGYSLFVYSSINHGYQRLVIRSGSGLRLRFLVSIIACVIVLFGVFIILDIVFIN